MANVSSFNKQKTDALLLKVENKLTALLRFLEGSNCGFTVPDKFTYNWFVSLSEGSLEPFSKSSKSVRAGSELRKRIDKLLIDCEGKLRKDTLISKGKQPKIAKLEREKQNLSAKIKHLKQQLDTCIDENIDLRRQVMELKRQLGISQAVWADKKAAKSRVSEGNFQ